jgi:hypothetical protein
LGRKTGRAHLLSAKSKGHVLVVGNETGQLKTEDTGTGKTFFLTI